ncbi:26541_t:CDS:1 [Dentiscutata erythropus]|uniref:26541_t:CDS:1 n=1 Tax=Dentiscutata erythropus TaxID=1348616 RepID=A0A9N9NXS2_9GLOM|nr:26541_t:CDS:1 [Dentiscutata erythropus]
MKKRASKTAKSRDIRFVNITPNVTRAGSSSCVNGHSLQNEYAINELTLDVENLIYPSNNLRRSRKTDDPPRPQNSFLLFRKDFVAKYRLLHQNEKISLIKISKLAAERWNVQPPSVRIFFKQLELKALKKHKEMYPNYRYSPNKKKKNPNVLGGNFSFVTSQSQDIEIPTQPSDILETKVFDNNTYDVMYDSNTYFQKEEDSFNYNYNNTFLTHGSDFYFDIPEPASFNTAFFEANDINNYFFSEPQFFF